MKKLVLLLCLLSGFVSAQTLSPKEITAIQQKVQQMAEEAVKADEVVVIETDFGKIVIELFAKETPKHATNFKKLVKAGYYEGCTFHRIVPGFVIQGGDILSRDNDPKNDGTGGPGYTLPAEFGVKHLRGYVAAARLPDQVNPKKESSGSQFYICLKDLPFLDQAGYTVFGKVIKGMDVVDKIATVQRDQRDRPLKDVVMKKVYCTNKSVIAK